MNTAQIEGLANAGNAARSAFNVAATLRHVVIPKFLLDVDDVVGKVYWRRATTSLSIANPTRNYDLPADFDWAQRIQPYGSDGTEYDALSYIGEDAVEVARTEATTVSGRPTGYYLVAGSATPFAARLNAIPDTSYTARVVYYRRIPFTDDVTSVDLDTYIPAQFQGCLIHGLKAEILADRYGMGDRREQRERERYDEWIVRMRNRKEGAGARHASFVD